MKLGKVTGNVETRSIRQQIRKAKRVQKTGAGDFCAVSASSAVYGFREESLERTFFAAVSQAAAEGLTDLRLGMSVFMPAEAKEDTLRRIVRELDGLCAEQGIAIDSVQSQVSTAVKEILIQITLYGVRARAVRKDFADRDVVMAGYLGAEGSMLLAKDEETLLGERYPARMIRTAQGFSDLLKRIPEAATATQSNICMAQAAGEGGIFKALWELAEKAGVGLNIEWKALPVRQETIEICNYLDLNPYELLSGGALVMICLDGNRAVEQLQQLNIPAALVGRTTEGHDRVLVNGEERRFLESGKADEIYKRR